MNDRAARMAYDAGQAAGNVDIRIAGLELFGLAVLIILLTVWVRSLILRSSTCWVTWPGKERCNQPNLPGRSVCAAHSDMEDCKRKTHLDWILATACGVGLIGLLAVWAAMINDWHIVDMAGR
jgi:hypothetical protein